MRYHCLKNKSEKKTFELIILSIEKNNYSLIFDMIIVYSLLLQNCEDLTRTTTALMLSILNFFNSPIGCSIGPSKFYCSRYNADRDGAEATCARIGGRLPKLDTPQKFSYLVYLIRQVCLYIFRVIIRFLPTATGYNVTVKNLQFRTHCMLTAVILYVSVGTSAGVASGLA